MPFQPFTPPPEPEHELTNVRPVRHAVVAAPITKASQLRTDPGAQDTHGIPGYENLSLWRHFRSDWGDVPTWIKWAIYLAVFVTFWWVSMPFRGLIIVLAVFWFFALGAHPATHIARTGADILDGDDD